MKIVVASFYKFVDLPDYVSLQTPLKEVMLGHEVKGSILLAAEGINATISGTRAGLDAVLAFLKKDPRFYDLQHKESYCSVQPFKRSKVRLKKEVISIGKDVSLHKKVGTYVAPSAWNALLANPDVIVIDARNSYETHLGTFEGAMDPDTRSFRQLPDFVKKTLDPKKHKKIATYCTGGIRCEKFSSYLLEEGFEEVYHLEGGILKYLEEIPAAESKWQGECFVFDERVAVGHGLVPTQSAVNCPGCGHSLTADDKSNAKYIPGESCHYCP